MACDSGLLTGDGKCSECHGSGRNPHFNVDIDQCQTCLGTGVCQTCKGEGYLDRHPRDQPGDLSIL